MLTIRNTFGRSGEMSNPSDLLLVFSCSVFINVENIFTLCVFSQKNRQLSRYEMALQWVACFAVVCASLPYLAFSSNPALGLRHFLRALSTCSPYCA